MSKLLISLSKFQVWIQWSWPLNSDFDINVCRWDTLISDLELVESYDGHYDILYGTNNPTYLSQ